jgi:hypothetical protein
MFFQHNCLNEAGLCLQNDRRFAPAIFLSSFSEGAAETLALFCSRGFSVIFWRGNGADRPFDFDPNDRSDGNIAYCRNNWLCYDFKRQQVFSTHHLIRERHDGNVNSLNLKILDH